MENGKIEREEDKIELLVLRTVGERVNSPRPINRVLSVFYYCTDSNIVSTLNDFACKIPYLPTPPSGILSKPALSLIDSATFASNKPVSFAYNKSHDKGVIVFQSIKHKHVITFSISPFYAEWYMDGKLKAKITSVNIPNSLNAIVLMRVIKHMFQAVSELVALIEYMKRTGLQEVFFNRWNINIANQ